MRDTAPTLSGTAEASSTVRVPRNGVPAGMVVADDAGPWSFTSPALADGRLVFTDAAGNVGAPSGGVGFYRRSGYRPRVDEAPNRSDTPP